MSEKREPGTGTLPSLFIADPGCDVYVAQWDCHLLRERVGGRKRKRLWRKTGQDLGAEERKARKREEAETAWGPRRFGPTQLVLG